jgi:hypothetical protein
MSNRIGSHQRVYPVLVILADILKIFDIYDIEWVMSLIDIDEIRLPVQVTVFYFGIFIGVEFNPPDVAVRIADDFVDRHFDVL